MRTVPEDGLPLDWLYHWEREKPRSVFLTQPYDGGKVREWTWAQTADEVRRMAAYLKAQNWEPGSRVGILSKNCAWWIMADLAIWMAGHVTVPVYPSLRPQTVRQILEHSDAKGCFLGATDEREAAAFGVPPGAIAVRFPTAVAGEAPLWDDLISSTRPLKGNPRRAADDLATIIYTSGTTGVPKGVMHSFRALRFVAAGLMDLLGIRTEQRILSYLPLAHIVERTGMEGPSLLLGFHLYFAESVESFVTDLRRARPTLFLSVPRILFKFQQGVFAKIPRQKLDRLLRVPVVNRYLKWKILKGLGLQTVRFAASGAAPLPQHILNWFRGLGLQLAEGYGMTETLITHLPKPDSVRPGYVGPPLAGVEQKLTEDGELLIRSPMNMLGYYKDPEGTKASFTADGYFRTGDVAVIDPDGQLKIVGRVKEQFKTSKGKYVTPAPIESKLAAHPAVEGCCLMGAGLPSPFAIVLLSAEARSECESPEARRELEASLRAQMEEVNAQLDPHERISFIAIVDGPWTVGNGMITPTLKVRRSALEDRYQDFIDAWNNRKSPVVWETAA